MACNYCMYLNLGPGKLKIFRSASYVHDENSSETCIERMPFPMLRQQHIVGVVGSFVNGTLHGTAKLVFGNNFTVISNFKNGTINGKIYWDSSAVSVLREPESD